MRRAAFLALLLAGCAFVPNDPDPAVGDGPLVSDCEPPFAFEGESSLAELGVLTTDEERNFGAQATLRGMFRITQDTVTHEEFAPPGAPGVVREGQMLCATWEDGGGISMLLSEPFPRRDDRSSNEGALPVGAIVLVVGVLLVGGVSWMAFRRERPDVG